MQIVLANPRGFCAGVNRAIEIVDRALKAFGAPIYVRHEVVHNRYVVDDLRQRGAVFVEEISEVPEKATVIFSAHGVSKNVQKEAQRRNLKIFDATCPLVTKVHIEVASHAANGCEVILIGHAGHPEVEGTMGQFRSENGSSIYLVETTDDVAALQIRTPDNVAYVTQTTLSVDDTERMIEVLRERFPKITGPRKDDICYATQNRQDSVKKLAESCDVILVVGSTNSSNSNRLREIAVQQGKPAYLIDTADDIKKSWFDDIGTVGITAGASAPEILVQRVIEKLQEWGGGIQQENKGIDEEVVFILPKALRG